MVAHLLSWVGAKLGQMRGHKATCLGLLVSRNEFFAANKQRRNGQCPPAYTQEDTFLARVIRDTIHLSIVVTYLSRMYVSTPARVRHIQSDNGHCVMEGWKYSLQPPTM